MMSVLIVRDITYNYTEVSSYARESGSFVVELLFLKIFATVINFHGVAISFIRSMQAK